ncbi:MAG TPA: GGDEF domain-containing protein [Firmicutes bacterium]|nr:GGDEF domain-containing protein [Bacillota bacterium]
MQKLWNILKSMLVPSVLLLVAHCLVVYGFLDNFSIQSLNYFVISIFLMSLVLCAWFGKSRYFFIFLLCLAVYLFRYYFFNLLYGMNQQMAQAVFSVLIFLNLLVFSLIKERGIFSFWGRIRFLFLFLQGVGWWLFLTYSSFFNGLYEQYMQTQFYLNFPYLQITLATLGMVLFLLLSLRTDYHYTSFIGFLIAPLLPLFYDNQLQAWIVFYSTIAIIGLTQVIMDLYSLAYLDELTGLAGRRALRQDTMKLSGAYTIAMLDIDFFKKVNDTYGHDVGDQVLKFVSGIAKKVTGGGKPYRYGGEEFTLVFPGKKKNEVIPHLEALRKSIGERPFVIRAKNRSGQKPEEIKKKRKGDALKINVTVSIGVADNVQKNVTPQDVIKEADRALYKAKKTGRNRVCV